MGRDTGIYRFLHGEEIGCYAIEGAKQVMGMFMDCLFVEMTTPHQTQQITIYNPGAHFIEYQGSVMRYDCLMN